MKNNDKVSSLSMCCKKMATDSLGSRWNIPSMVVHVYHTVVCFPVTLGLAYSTNSSISTGHAPEKKQEDNSTWWLSYKINVSM